MPETLYTDRLVLRTRDASEASVYRQLWTERDPRVPPHRRIDDDGRPSLEDIAARVRADSDAEPGKLWAVVRRHEGDVIGYCGLIPSDPGEADLELAFELLRTAHGRGYATEAGGAVVAWARRAGCGRLRARVWDWNTASRRVLDKLGFRETGTEGPASVHGRTLLTVRDL